MCKMYPNSELWNWFLIRNSDSTHQKCMKFASIVTGSIQSYDEFWTEWVCMFFSLVWGNKRRHKPNIPHHRNWVSSRCYFIKTLAPIFYFSADLITRVGPTSANCQQSRLTWANSHILHACIISKICTYHLKLIYMINYRVITTLIWYLDKSVHEFMAASMYFWSVSLVYQLSGQFLNFLVDQIFFWYTKYFSGRPNFFFGQPNFLLVYQIVFLVDQIVFLGWPNFFLVYQILF